MKKKFLTLGLFCICTLSACGGGSASASSAGNSVANGGSTNSTIQGNTLPAAQPTTNAGYIYATSNNNALYAYKIDPASGTLTAVAGSPYSPGPSPVGLAVNSSQSVLYVVNHNTSTAPFGSSQGSITAYSINANTGSLTPVGNSLPTGNGAYFMHLTPNGAFGYVSNSVDGTISGYAVDASTGALTPLPGSPFAAGPDVINFAITPDNRHLYAVSVQGNAVYGYTIGSDGVLTQVPNSPFATGMRPNTISLSPDGGYAYVMNDGVNDTAGSVSEFSINADGSLSQLSGSPMTTAVEPAVLTFQNGFAYLGCGTYSAAGSIAVYKLNANGTLTPTGSNVSTGKGMFSFDFNPTKTQVFAPNAAEGTISVFDVALTSGALSPAEGSPINVPGGGGGVDVLFTPDAKFGYIGTNINQMRGEIDGISVDPTNAAMRVVAAAQNLGGIVGMITVRPK